MQHKCPNCGHDVEMPPVASPTGDYCPDCGALMTEFNSKKSSCIYAFLMLMLILVFVGSLGMGLLGACFILIGASDVPYTGSQYLLPGILIIAGAIVVGGLCIWGMNKIKK